MENLILVFLIVLIIGAATWYIIRAKKRGTRCIGCSASGACCNCNREKEEL